MQIEGSRILVTGGSSGIGRATAAALVERGAQVAITGRDQQKLQQTASAIGAVAADLDQSRHDQIPDRLAAIVDRLGGLDVLINNAGIGERLAVGELTAEAFERVYAVNVIGVALLTQAAVPVFKKQGRGHIVNIASTAALNGYPTGTVYCSSKFALRGMTQCWQKELRPHDIRVSLVNPSEVPTAFGQADRASRPEEAGGKTRIGRPRGRKRRASSHRPRSPTPSSPA